MGTLAYAKLFQVDAMQVPIYDFKLSKRVGYRTQKQPTSRVVIIEGIYSLSARLRQACGQN